MSALASWGLASDETRNRELALGAVRHAVLRSADDAPSDEEIARAYALLLDRVAPDAEADASALANALGCILAPGRGKGVNRARAEWLADLTEDMRSGGRPE